MSVSEDVGALLLLEDRPFVDEEPISTVPVSSPEEPWWDRFLFDRYDLDGWESPYAIVPLTRGYFAIVDHKIAKQVLRYSWYAEILKDSGPERSVYGIYAARRATKAERAKGAPKKIYLHRTVRGTIYSGHRVVVDHRSGYGLDNRRCNLKVTDHSGNLGNTRIPKRTVYSDLLRGVEPILTITKNGTVRKITGYHGTIRVRGKRLRSKTIFRDPMRAHRWYCRMHAVLFPHSDSWNGTKQRPLVFPPERAKIAEQKPCRRSPIMQNDESIPF